MRATTLAVVSAIGLSLAATGSAQAGKCVKASVKGWGVGTEMAGVIAKASLAEALAYKKWKGKGKVKLSCKHAFPLDECKATQKACS